jgi:hypothetical protein
MSENLEVEVRGDIIIVSEPKTGFYGVYAKPSGEPWLKAQGMPNGTHEFKAQAWRAANDKARELGGLSE